MTDAVQAVDSHDAHGGMRYLCAEDARERTASQPFDVMIVWRYMNYFLYFSAEEMARKTVLWMHDVYPAAWCVFCILTSSILTRPWQVQL